MMGKSRFLPNEKHNDLEAHEKLPETSQREAVVKLGVPWAT